MSQNEEKLIEITICEIRMKMKIESIKNVRFVVSFYANLKYEFIETGSNSRHDIIA